MIAGLYIIHQIGGSPNLLPEYHLAELITNQGGICYT